MKRKNSSKGMGMFCAAIVLGLALLALPGAAVSQNKPVPGAMLGYVYGEDMKTPVENAVVQIRNLKDGSEFTCAPTGKDGKFTLTGIEEGRYILGVSTGDGNFNFGYPVLVKGQETASLALTLMPAGAALASDRQGKLAPAPNFRESDGFFRNPTGEAGLGPDDGTAIINCIDRHNPPKPPKSRHHPHD